MNIDLTKIIHDKMISHQFVMSVMGNISQDLLRSVLKITEKKLDEESVSEAMKHRIFHFMIECSQNLCKHGNSDIENDSNIFLISKKEGDYFFYLGNIFDVPVAESIIAIIDKVNSLNADQVKDSFFKELMENGQKEQPKLLMSLLDISKRTKEKISYELIHVNEMQKFLCFKTKISSFSKTNAISA